MNRTIPLLILLCLLLARPVPAQVLEVDPERIGEVVERPVVTGMTYSGTHGLLTIPTAAFNDKESISVSHKGGISRSHFELATQSYDLFKNEHWTSLSFNLQPNLEFYVLHYRYDRSSDYQIGGLNYDEQMTGFGLKYSTHNGKQDFCFGATFTPMSAKQLNRADLAQIEQLRNVYMTVTEDVASGVIGYLNLKTCFTNEQEIDLGNGSKHYVDRKDFLVGSVGLEYKHTEAFSMFTEAQFFNYRDIYDELGVRDASRYSINAGMRGGSRNLQLEVAGMSLSDNPWMTLGVDTHF